MKTTSTRLVISIAVTLLIIGIILSSVGWFFGGATNIEYNNGWSVGIHGVNFSPNGGVGRQGSINEKLQQFTNIDIDTDVAEIKIVIGADYSIDIVGGVNPVEFSVDNGTLTVKQREVNRVNILNFGIGHDYNSEITISVPASAQLQNVKINNDVGDIDIENLTCDYLDVKTDVGETDIRVNANRLEVASDVGDMFIQGAINGNINLKADVGEIDLNLNGDQNDYRINAKNGVGQLTINGSTYGLDSDVTLNNDAKYSLTLQTGVGEANINISK